MQQGYKVPVNLDSAHTTIYAALIFLLSSMVSDDTNANFDESIKRSTNQCEPVQLFCGLESCWWIESIRPHSCLHEAIFRRGLRFLSTRGRIYHLVEILGHGMPLRLILGTNAKKGARSWKWRILLRTCIPLWFEIAAEGNLSELDMMVYYLLRRNWNWKLVLSEVRSYVHDSVLLRLASDDCTKPRAPSESS